MEFKKMLLPATVFMVVSQIIHTIGAAFAMDFYIDPSNFCLWSDLMMPSYGPPGTEFYLASLILGLALGLAFAGVYSMLRKSIPGKGYRKGITFGMLLFVLSSLPMAMQSFLILAVPAPLLLSWAAEALAIDLIGGMVFWRLLE